jgi:hypothetical protein
VLETVYKTEHADIYVGWFAYLILPMTLALAAAVWYARRTQETQSGRAFARSALLFCTWVYFLLNWVYFDFPWPWAQWTARTPNGIIFTVCAIGLTVAALTVGRRQSAMPPLPENALAGTTGSSAC